MNEIMRYSIALEWGEEKAGVNWYDAMDWCQSLGYGWRAPTPEELLLARAIKVPGFTPGSYWSSAEYFAVNAWYLCFLDGFTRIDYKHHVHSVRAVREVQP